MNSIRFLGMNDFTEIDCMTLYEYDMRMKAFQLRQIDKEYDIHLQAWANWNVQAMKKQGKNKRVPVFKNFKQFFDYDKRVNSVIGCKDNSKANWGVIGILKRQEERRKDGKL